MTARPMPEGKPMRFGKLLVLKIHGTTKMPVDCICDCGKLTQKIWGSVLLGRTRSCGCLSGETSRRLKTKHGKKASTCPTYSSWRSMRKRCQNSEKPQYIRSYSGVTYCERWEDFLKFAEDMGERPAGTSLDRIDNSKGYFPENCRWASPQVQGENRRVVIMIQIGTEVKGLAQWCREKGINRKTVHTRISKGWDKVEAILTPSKRNR